MKFVIEYTDNKSSARCGKIYTDHGIIETPVFMPVGTNGAVKSIHTKDLISDSKASIILSNTYHLPYILI